MPLSNSFDLRKPERKEFEVMPEDTYEVVVEKMEDIERKSWENPDEIEMVIKFIFFISEDGKWKNRKLWKEAAPVLWPGTTSGNPSMLYRIFSAVTGRKPTQEECETGVVTKEDINALEGGKLRVVVGQKKKKDGGLKNDITGFLPTKHQEDVATASEQHADETEDSDTEDDEDVADPF